MRLSLVAVGERVPAWVSEGYTEYARRLPRHCALQLVEVAPGRRSRAGDAAKAVEEEGERLLAAVPRGTRAIALDERGRQWSTLELADALREWMGSGDDVAFLVGGADGLSQRCRAAASHHWSLSKLTLPHALVRVLVAEQLYRAWTVVSGHPYHRG